MISKIFLFIAILSTVLLGQELTVEISLEKDVYEEGEPIITMEKITNNSNNDYIITYTMDDQFTFIIEDKSGKNIERIIEKWRGFDFDREICLKPGEFITHFTELSTFKGNLLFRYPLFSSFITGSYSIQLKFGNRLIMDSRDTLRNNVIISNKIFFKMIPASDQLKNVLETLKNDFNNGDSEIFKNSLKMNIEKNSYSSFDYLFMIRYFPFLPVESRSEILNLIIQYPNNYWAAQFSYRCRDIISLDDPKIKGTILWQSLKSDLIWDREMMKNKSKYFIQEKDKK